MDTVRLNITKVDWWKGNNIFKGERVFKFLNSLGFFTSKFMLSKMSYMFCFVFFKNQTCSKANTGKLDKQFVCFRVEKRKGSEWQMRGNDNQIHSLLVEKFPCWTTKTVWEGARGTFSICFLIFYSFPGIANQKHYLLPKGRCDKLSNFFV